MTPTLAAVFGEMTNDVMIKKRSSITEQILEGSRLRPFNTLAPLLVTGIFFLVISGGNRLNIFSSTAGILLIVLIAAVAAMAWIMQYLQLRNQVIERQTLRSTSGSTTSGANSDLVEIAGAISVARLKEEIGILGNRANVNLALGCVLSLMGMGFLAYFVISPKNPLGAFNLQVPQTNMQANAFLQSFDPTNKSGSLIVPTNAIGGIDSMITGIVISNQLTESVKLSLSNILLREPTNRTPVHSLISTHSGSNMLSEAADKPTPEDASLEMKAFLFTIVPRLSFVLFTELFALFFLKLYKGNLAELKYYQNEITNLEMKHLALRLAMASTKEDILKEVLRNIVATERNFVLQKEQTTVELERARLEKSSQTDILKSAIEVLKHK